MKKTEALILAPENINVIMEYITTILEDTEKVTGAMEINSAKIDGQNMCTVDIYVPTTDFEKHLNLGITSDHINVIYQEFLNKVITNLLPSETIGASRFYQLRSSFDSFDGITIINSIGSEIKVNMYGIDKDISNEYNMKYDQYQNNLINKNNSYKSKI